MKKIYSVLIGLLFISLLVSCGKKDVEDQVVEEEVVESIEYSNLVDNDTKEELIEEMKKVNISEDNINEFIERVNDYNKTVDYISLVEKGFKKSERYEIDYDIIEMDELWQKEKGMFIGNNCRMTTLDLMNDFIEIENIDTSNIDNLFMDIDAIENDPSRDINDEKYDRFKTLYGQVKTENTKDQDVHIKNLKDAFNKRGIKYNTGDKLSQISVVFHSELDSILFIGHTGVLIEEGDNLLFIEKLSFQEPYQFIKFKDRIELNDYLMGKYDLSYGQEEAKPFIMENDHLMEGYRPNINNIEE